MSYAPLVDIPKSKKKKTKKVKGNSEGKKEINKSVKNRLEQQAILMTSYKAVQQAYVQDHGGHPNIKMNDVLDQAESNGRREYKVPTDIKSWSVERGDDGGAIFEKTIKPVKHYKSYHDVIHDLYFDDSIISKKDVVDVLNGMTNLELSALGKPQVIIYRSQLDKDFKKMKKSFPLNLSSNNQSSFQKFLNGQRISPGGYGLVDLSLDVKYTSEMGLDHNIYDVSMTIFFNSFEDMVEPIGESGETPLDILGIIGGELSQLGRKYTNLLEIKYSEDVFNDMVKGGITTREKAEKMSRVFKNLNRDVYLVVKSYSVNFSENGTWEVSLEYVGYSETMLYGLGANVVGSNRDVARIKSNKMAVKGKKRRLKEEIVSDGDEEIIEDNIESLESDSLRIMGLLHRDIPVKLIHNSLYLANPKNMNKLDWYDYVISEAQKEKISIRKLSKGSDDAYRIQDRSIGSAGDSDKEKKQRVKFNVTDLDNFNIYYFYVKDLFFYIFDNVLNNHSEVYGTNLLDLEMMFGEVKVLDFKNPYNDDGTENYIFFNIGDLPISYDLFISWWNNEVVGKKRTIYTFKDFISGFMNNIIKKILRYDNLYGVESAVDDLERRQVDLKTYILMKEVEGRYKYICYFYSDEEKDTYKYIKEREPEIMKFYVGKDTGIMKTISFNKEENSLVRSSYLENQIDVIEGKEGEGTFETALREWYNVDITTFGNTFLVPGIWINVEPSVIGLGVNMYSEEQKSKLRGIGIRGYYMIYSTSFKWDQSKFETSITGKFQSIPSEEQWYLKQAGEYEKSSVEASSRREDKIIKEQRKERFVETREEFRRTAMDGWKAKHMEIK